MIQILNQHSVQSGRAVLRDWFGLTVTSGTGQGEDQHQLRGPDKTQDQHNPLAAGSGLAWEWPDPALELNQETVLESGQRLM